MAIENQENQEEIALLQIDPSDPQLFLVLGNQDEFDFGDYLGFGEIWEPKDTEDFLQQMAKYIPIGAQSLNLITQSVGGIKNATGLVRLTGDTLNQIKNGAQPLVSAGENLGSLVKNGKIVSSIRWTPAGAGASTLVAGPAIAAAIALAGISFQISRIEKHIKVLIDKVEQIQEFLEHDQLAGLFSAAKRLSVLRRQAITLGYVPESTLLELPVLNERFNHAIEFSEIRIRNAFNKLITSNQYSEKWLKENADVFTKEIFLHQMASSARYFADLIKAKAELANNTSAGEVIEEDAKMLHANDRENIELTLNQVIRRLDHTLTGKKPKNENLDKFKKIRELLIVLSLNQAPSRISSKLRESVKGELLNKVERIELQLSPKEELRGIIFLTRKIVASTSHRNIVCEYDGINKITYRVNTEKITSVKVKDVWNDWNADFKDSNGELVLRLELCRKGDISLSEAERDANRLSEALRKPFDGVVYSIGEITSLKLLDNFELEHISA